MTQTYSYEELDIDKFGPMQVPDDLLGDNFESFLDQETLNSFFEYQDLDEINSFVNATLSLVNYSINPTELPREIGFSSDNLVSIIAYACLFVVAAIGNLTVFITLFRTRRRKSRVNTFIMHLTAADLIVTFIMLPLETAWHIVVAWRAGEFACRLLMFCRAFGFYLSSFILVTISLDRYFSIVHPLSIHDADKRGKMFLIFSWLLSAMASLPQSVIFHVERHPVYTWFEQCVTFNFFPTPTHELAYNLFTVITVYLLPLVVITTSYTGILYTISKNARRAKNVCLQPKVVDITRPQASCQSTRSLLRCSTAGRIGKAKIRTLKMTLVIVSAFIICWTPYFFMSAMWWFSKESARRVEPKVQRGLFIFAVSNSCVNPIVYGMFTTAFRREAKKWKDWFRDRLSKIGLYTSTPTTLEQEYLG